MYIYIYINFVCLHLKMSNTIYLKGRFLYKASYISVLHTYILNPNPQILTFFIIQADFRTVNNSQNALEQCFCFSLHPKFHSVLLQ